MVVGARYKQPGDAPYRLRNGAVPVDCRQRRPSSSGGVGGQSKCEPVDVPILDRPAEDGDAKPMALPTVRALAPRLAGRSLFYLSSQGTGDGLWRFEDGKAVEILKGSDEALFEPPAVSADGRQLAVILRRDGKRCLHVLSADGGDLQSLAEPIDIEGTVCWSPDGKWIVAGGL